MLDKKKTCTKGKLDKGQLILSKYTRKSIS